MDENLDSALDLVVALCGDLEHHGISYCHWKSNEAIDASASGDNDLDLLIAREDADRFDELTAALGFKAARPIRAKEVPGLLDSYGLDERSGRLVHLQAHYQLVLGDDMTKNFHLPIEPAYLASQGRTGLFRLPAPEDELAVFVVRMVLKHASWDAQLSLMGKLSASERRELSDLLAQVPAATRAEALAQRLQFLDPDLVARALAALVDRTPPWRRAAMARELERALAPYARRPRWVDVPLRFTRRGMRVIRHVVGSPSRKRLTAGGAVIAVIGDPPFADTVADQLATWLTPLSSTRLYLADESGTAAARARRHATNGGLALCDGPRRAAAVADIVVELDPSMGPGELDAVLHDARRTVWHGL